MKHLPSTTMFIAGLTMIWAYGLDTRWLVLGAVFAVGGIIRYGDEL